MSPSSSSRLQRLVVSTDAVARHATEPTRLCRTLPERHVEGYLRRGTVLGGGALRQTSSAQDVVVRLKVLFVHQSVDHPVNAGRRPQEEDTAEVEGVREVAARVEGVQDGYGQVGDGERHEYNDDRLEERDLALQSRRRERAASVHRLSAAPHQEVYTHVAVEYEDGGHRQERDLLEHAGDAEFGVAHERTEHDALVEGDGPSCRGGRSPEPRQRRRDDDQQRGDVDDTQHGGDGARPLQHAADTRMHDDEVPVQRNGRHVQDALQYGEVARVQRVEARPDAELPLADDVRVHVERLDEDSLDEVAHGERHDEHVGRLVEVATEQDGQDDEHVTEYADDDDDDAQHGAGHHHGRRHVVVGVDATLRENRRRHVVEGSVYGACAGGAGAHRRGIHIRYVCKRKRA